MERQMDSWAQRNTQKCPGCKALVQRNGGCNHMVCRCGSHFCYVCGRRWEEHQSQEGGMDYYRCRLEKLEGKDQLQNQNSAAEDPVAKFDAAERSSKFAGLWAKQASELCEAMNYCIETRRDGALFPYRQALAGALPEVVDVLLEARQTIRFCAVCTWDAARKNEGTGLLECWLGELEAACSTLEASLGPAFELAWTETPESLVIDSTRWQLLEKTGELQTARRLQCLAARLDDLLRLRDAVSRLNFRLLSGARNGKCQGEPPGALEALGRRFLSWFGF